LRSFDRNIDLDQYPRHMTPLIAGSDPGGRQPIGLGPRVPMIVVSPWTKGGWVCSQVFDHTSVLQFLEVRFGVPEPNIGKWRTQGNVRRPDIGLRFFRAS
jgi:phospholipase C